MKHYIFIYTKQWLPNYVIVNLVLSTFSGKKTSTESISHMKMAVQKSGKSEKIDSSVLVKLLKKIEYSNF